LGKLEFYVDKEMIALATILHVEKKDTGVIVRILASRNDCGQWIIY
jgi:hypothetical protein